MRSFFEFEINGYNFMFSIGDGIIINPDEVNCDDPNFINGLKQACSMTPLVAKYISLCEWSMHGNFGRPLQRMDQGEIDSILRSYEALKDHITIKLNDDILSFVRQVQEENNRRELKAKDLQIRKQRRTAKSKGYVYLIQSPTGSYKIGRTVDPDNRIKTFNVKLPFEVNYIAVIATVDMYSLESELHNQFSDKRVNGEWFTLSPEDVEYIKGLAS